MTREAAIHPDAVEFAYFDQCPAHNAIWDMTAAPDGPVYIGLCNEGDPGLSAQLHAYEPRTGTVRRLFDVAEATHDDVAHGHIPQSKFHTAMGVGRDGRLYAPTHTTAPGIGREFWDIEQAYDDRRVAYPGSHYLVYDPRTGTVEDRGIPVPYESIYGALLDAERGIHYFLTILHGRLFRYEIATGRLRDLGRVARGGHFAMFKDKEGRVFGAETDGHLWRYDPNSDRLSFLNISMPRPPERAQLLTGLQEGEWGPDGRYYSAALYEGRLFAYDPFDGAEGRFEDLGMGWGEYRPDQERQNLMWAPIFAPDGCLYYGFAGYQSGSIRNTNEYNLRIIRYDPKSRTRENLGVVFDRGSSSLLFGAGARGTDGRIYWGDGCSSLHAARLVILDPAKVRPAGSGPLVELSPMTSGQSAAGVARAQKLEEKMRRSADCSAAEERLDLVRVYRAVLPDHECALTALAAAGESVFAVTSGRACHVLEVEDHGPAGALPAAPRVLASVGVPLRATAIVPDAQTLWVAFMPADGAAGPSLLAVPRGGGDATWIDMPEDAGGIAAMVRLNEDHLVLLGANGVLWEYETASRRFRRLFAVGDRRVSPVLAIDGEARVWGAVEEGFLFTVDVNAGRGEILAGRIPASRGCHYAAIWQAAAGGKGEPIYGGTAEGFLFRLDTTTGVAVNLGKPAVAPEIRCLALDRTGTVWGVSGEKSGLARIFSYSPTAGFADLGRPVLWKKALWCGHSFAAAVRGPGGKIWLGEDDTQAHLWRLDPETPGE